MHKCISVPYIDQTKYWPTGCESVSAVMLLNYLKCDITVDEFIKEFLPMKAFWDVDGVIYGANPNVEFAGSPYDRESFGCYAPVIEKVLNNIFERYNMPYKAVSATGVETEELLKKYIDRDIPVVYWASIELKPTIIGPEWKLDNGETFMWISNEHCMLLVGYDDKKLYFNDPWLNKMTIGYDKELVIKRHKEQYSMAVAVERL